MDQFREPLYGVAFAICDALVAGTRLAVSPDLAFTVGGSRLQSEFPTPRANNKIVLRTNVRSTPLAPENRRTLRLAPEWF